jgi:hypothetical protein
VRLRQKTFFLFSILLFIPIILGFTTLKIKTNDLVYSIDKEYAKVWVNTDGTVDIFYNITVSCSSGSIGFLTVGIPETYSVDYVTDNQGSPLNFEDISTGSDYLLDIELKQRIGPDRPNKTATLLILVNVRDMVWEDKTNEGNVGVLFTPAWWDNPPAPIIDLRVQIVAPEDVTQSELKTNLSAMIIQTDDGISAYWERTNLRPSEKVSFGVSFPEKYVSNFNRSGPDILLYIGLIIAIIAIVIIVIIVFAARRRIKDVYKRPKISMEALGPARGLTAPEAAVVLGLKPIRVLTMILYGLLRKGLVEILQSEPLVKLSELTIGPQKLDNSEVSRISPKKRYYEILFLNSIKSDGSLDERLLARAYMVLRDNVDNKIRGYSRTDTANYYKSIVTKAWTQVTQAETPELKLKTIDEQLEWLLADEKYGSRFRDAFPGDILIHPHPLWYWYWGGFSRTGSAKPQDSTTPKVEPKPIPAQEFADRLVSSIEKSANNMVKNFELLANRIVAQKPVQQSSRPVRKRSSCVCACASCACACACVSCACACAGGGAR